MLGSGARGYRRAQAFPVGRGKRDEGAGVLSIKSVDERRLREVALTSDEYRAIVEQLKRAPNEVELGMLGVLWSEHCSYKSSKALLRRLPSPGPGVVQGPGENAGAVEIGEGWSVVFKIESHNHPSAIEPYQGAATGVGGIIRDVIAMGARPIALLDSLRFGPLPASARHVEGVVAGIGGYGNCIGIPTVGGEVYFEDCYASNPLVNAMCVGLVRTDELMRARAEGAGNSLMLVGADTGRDGIHGASFASLELDEQSAQRRPAVQVGNPFLEKCLLEACMDLAHTDAVVAIQDLGAAGPTSALAECGRPAEGARVGFGCSRAPTSAAVEASSAATTTWSATRPSWRPAVTRRCSASRARDSGSRSRPTATPATAISTRTSALSSRSRRRRATSSPPAPARSR